MERVTWLRTSHKALKIPPLYISEQVLGNTAVQCTHMVDLSILLALQVCDYNCDTGDKSKNLVTTCDLKTYW